MGVTAAWLWPHWGKATLASAFQKAMNQVVAQPGERGRWAGRLAKLLAIASVAVVGVLILGAVYEARAESIDSVRYPAPGWLIDVGGYRLHLQCEGAGSPTIVLEAALGAGSSSWAWVRPDLVQVTRVCAYDRAGEGWSDLGPEPRDALQVARELRALLEVAGIQGPYVLAGHSFGGLYVRAYAAEYRDDVSGMVLIDASHPDQWVRSEQGRGAQRANEQSAAVAPWLARVGLLRATGFFAVDPGLPDQQQAEIRAFMNASRLWTSYSAVFRAVDRTMDQVRNSRPLDDRPLAVLTATEHGLPAEAEQLHQILQAELLSLSRRSVHRVINGATHVSLVNNREQAQITTAAIREVVEVSRG
jgi:pimeloyl-ACP methyl ester carboxylesterase